jgi:hypothetical protein
MRVALALILAAATPPASVSPASDSPPQLAQLHPPPRPPSLLVVAAPQTSDAEPSAAVAEATRLKFDDSVPVPRYGGWWARLPLKRSTDLPSSEGDTKGTIQALRAANMSMVGFEAAACGTAHTPGDTGTGGVGLSDFVDFLDAAAGTYPELRVFAQLSSHGPLTGYCPTYLNDAKTDVNWTRTAAIIANRTLGRSNFVGLYLDDFYAMICRPEVSIDIL